MDTLASGAALGRVNISHPASLHHLLGRQTAAWHSATRTLRFYGEKLPKRAVAIAILHDPTVAVGITREWQPNEILLDLTTREMGGYCLAPTLRAAGDGAIKRMLAIKGHPADAEKLSDATINSHVLKSVDQTARNIVESFASNGVGTKGSAYLAFNLQTRRTWTKTKFSSRAHHAPNKKSERPSKPAAHVAKIAQTWRGALKPMPSG
jgi:CheY-like chemotaxis protein